MSDLYDLLQNSNTPPDTEDTSEENTESAPEALTPASVRVQPAGTPANPPARVKKGMGWGGVMLLLLILALLLGVLCFFIGRYFFGGKEDPVPSGESSVSESVPADSESESTNDSQTDSGTPFYHAPEVDREIDGLSYVGIAAKASPSVVEITTEVVTTGSFMTQYISSGAGSGVIFSEDGYIVTNNHVIESARTISVTLNDGRVFPATLIGLDEEQDIALLKIEAEGLIPAELGRSENLLVGQEVVAIGNPLGQLGGTVTNGIISALNRRITIDGISMNLLQTNAAINPGNSGGGLFDAAGRLIAIVNAKYADAEIEGLGFAIPIDDVLSILDDLYEYGYVKGRAYLGVSLVDVNTTQAAWMYRVNRLGLYIYSVEKDSAAELAGLRSGDLILSVNDTAVEDSAQFAEVLAGLRVGDTVVLRIYRNKEEQEISVVASEYIPEAVRDSRYH